MSGNDTSTKLLIHADGADASTTFTDASASAHTITAVGNAQIDTAQSKFGGASALFDGTGDYLSVPDSADWSPGANPWTMDCWIRFSSVAAARYIAVQQTDATNGVFWYWFTDNNMYFQVFAAGVAVVNMSRAWSPVIDTWYHVAVVRTGTDYMMFVDGTQIGTTLSDADNVGNYTGVFAVGARADTGAGHAGWIDEFRYSSIARWTANFTPPTAPYSNNTLTFTKRPARIFTRAY